MGPRTRLPVWPPSPCRSVWGKMVLEYLVPGYLISLNLRRSVYMLHPCGIPYVVLGTYRYLDSTFIITIFSNILHCPFGAHVARAPSIGTRSRPAFMQVDNDCNTEGGNFCNIMTPVSTFVILVKFMIFTAPL
jgi:hypothetical protein